MNLSVVLLFISFAGLAACGESSACTREGTPAPVANEGIGGPCRASNDCASGLVCETVFGGGTALSGFTCTLDCTNASCPAGTACVDTGQGIPVDGAAVEQIICLPTCSSDADCQRGTRAGRCGAPTDAGSPRTCAPLSCYVGGQGGITTCPSGYACKEYPVGCGSEHSGAPTGGWCEKAP